tara:strand:- start:2051 stop:2224 length:174 start_codon:yes stop_codon:yes gene_type:complete
MDIEDYVEDALNSFKNDPADTDYQRGYRDCLVEIQKCIYNGNISTTTPDWYSSSMEC